MVQISAPTLELHGIYGMNYINKQVMHRSSLALYLTAGVTNLQQRGQKKSWRGQLQFGFASK
jgi:hypothetical protein